MKRFASFVFVFTVFVSFFYGCSFTESMKNTFKNDDVVVTETDKIDNSKDEYQMVIQLPLNSDSAYINGEKYTLDTAPAFVNKEEVTMVPLKFLSDVMAAKIEWFPNTKEISILQRDGEIQLMVNRNFAYVNGEEYRLTSSPSIVKGRAFVPLKFVATQLKFDVEWIPETKTVVLRK
ncbi:MAG: copper amine oxidase N-terminal domain-containing protein [Caldisericia bacterium]|nr:copper amine oxidase N-terminal domain-containing protein [Caldisericia bacterium]